MYIPTGLSIEHCQKTLNGVFTSMIPEEIEDFPAQSESEELLNENNTEIVQSFLNEIETPEYPITEEIKKLGLTAEINDNNNNASFDSYLIEVSPNVHVVYHCMEHGPEKDQPKDDEIVLGTTNVQTVPHLQSPTLKVCPRLEKSDVQFRTCFMKRRILNTTQPSNPFDCTNDNSHVNERTGSDTASICSNIDSFNSFDEGNFTFSDFEWNSLKLNDSLRRTNSENSLQKITNGIHMCDTCQETIEHSDTQTKTLGCKFSTTCTKELDNTKNSGESLKIKIKVSTDDSSAILNGNNCPNKIQQRPRAKTIGVIRWAKCNKIRLSKRESNMFSPTTF